MKLQLFCFCSRNNLMSLIAYKASGLSKEEMRVWDYIRMHDSVTRLDIESLLGVDSKKAVRVLNKLIDKSLVVSEGKSRGES